MIEILEYGAIVIVGVLLGVDIALLQRANRALRRELVAIAKQRAAQMSVHKMTIECDNSNAITALREVEAAAHAALAAARQADPRNFH